MRTTFAPVAIFAFASWACAGQEVKVVRSVEAGQVTAHSQGLLGYIDFSHNRPPAGSGYSAGLGFYPGVFISS